MKYILPFIFLCIAPNLFRPAINAQYLATQPTPIVDFTQYGFPRVLITKDFDSSYDMPMDYGDVHVLFPAHTFSHTVTIELLGGNTRDFVQPNTVSLSILEAFAFRIKDNQGNIVNTANNPILITITNSHINAQSNVYGSTPTHPITLILLPNPPSTSNHTMHFSYTRLDLGLVAVTPALATQPSATAEVPPILVALVIILLIILAAAIILRAAMENSV